MGELESILSSGLTPRQKSTALADALINQQIDMAHFFEYCVGLDDATRAVCSETVERISAVAPELLVPYVHHLVECVSCHTSQVKVHVQKAVGNIAKRFPHDVELAIPGLISNTEDCEEDVRRCAALSLVEIARNNAEMRADLVPLLQDLAKGERVVDVKRVYLEALRLL